MCSFPSGICTGIDSFFDAIGYLFDSFVYIPPADGEFTNPHKEPVKDYETTEERRRVKTWLVQPNEDRSKMTILT